MNAQDNISMNSSRPIETIKDKAHNANYKEILQEKEDKIRELLDKNDKLEKDCLKFQVHLKSLEDKLKAKNEKDYVTKTNTSSNFILPSEFKTLWEEFAKENLSDCLIDFFDNPVVTFHLIQELIYLCTCLIQEQMSLIFNNIILLLKMPNDKSSLKYLESTIKPIFQEYFTQIFESETARNEFVSRFKDQYTNFYHNHIIRMMNSVNTESVFNEMISSRSFINMISNVKKLILFAEFHDPPLKFDVEEVKTRKIECRVLKNSECLCVEGLIKENKSCLILLGPPLMKNRFVYKGLKPIVIAYDGDLTIKGGMEIQNNKKDVNLTAQNHSENKEEKQMTNTISNFQMIQPKSNEKADLSSLFEVAKSKNNREAEIPRASSFENQILFSNLNTNGKDFIQTSHLSNSNSSINCNSPNVFQNSIVEGGLECEMKKNILMNDFNVRSASYHNLFSMSERKNRIEDFTTDTRGEPNNSSQQPHIIRNSGLMFESEHENKQNLTNNTTNLQLCPNNIEEHHTVFNKNSQSQSHFSNIRKSKTDGMRTFEKVEGVAQSSRSQFESKNIEMEYENFIDLDIDLIPIGTEDNYPIKDKPFRVMATSLPTSGKTNKNQDKINAATGMSINIEPTGKLFESDDSDYKDKLTRKLTSTTTFSEKKVKDNMYLVQSSERVLERMTTKGNPVSFRSDFTKHVMRSLSKTPKPQNPRVLGYSPQSNVIYHFSDKKLGNCNKQGELLTGDKRKGGNLTGSRELAPVQKPLIEKKNSNYSSVSASKEKRNTFFNIAEMHQANKTVDDKNQNMNLSSKNINTSSKYNEYIKSKLRLKMGHHNTIIMKTPNSNNLMVHHNDNPTIMNHIHFLNLKQLSTPNDQALSSVGKTKQINISYSKNTADKKKNPVPKENNNHERTEHNQLESKIANNSNDKKIFEKRTNAVTKVSIEELLSLKKKENNFGSPSHHKEGGRLSASHTLNSGGSMNNNIMNGKANYLNIKYV